MRTDCVYIFDADGVVIEPWGFADVLAQEFSITPDQTRGFFSGPFSRCLVGAAALRDVLDPFLSEWRWQGSAQEFIDLWLQSENLPRQDVLELVSDLRKDEILCCLASNQEHLRARYIEEQMGFADLFDRTYFSCDLGAMKPEAKFYRTIADDLGIDAEAIHFWDDSLGHVEGAKRCGWNAYVYEDLGSVPHDV